MPTGPEKYVQVTKKKASIRVFLIPNCSIYEQGLIHEKFRKDCHRSYISFSQCFSCSLLPRKTMNFHLALYKNIIFSSRK